MRPHHVIAAILLLCASWSVALASAVDVAQYLALRKKQSAVPVRITRDDPLAYQGKIVEVRGRLSGVSKSETRGCLIVSTDDGSYVIHSQQLPSESTGTQLACLARVGDGADCSAGGLQLVAWTYDADLRRAEESTGKAPAKAPEPKKIEPTAGKAEPAKPQAKKTAELTVEDYVAIYRKAIKGFNKRLSDKQADTIARSVLGFSTRYVVDPRLVCAVILAESNFRVDATSHCGAMGLGQLMPGTAAGLGVSNAYDPVENIYGSVRYIKSMLDRMSGKKHYNDLTWNDLAKALAAYNAGPGAVKKHGGVPPYKETQGYVKKVTAIYKKLCGVSS